MEAHGEEEQVLPGHIMFAAVQGRISEVLSWLDERPGRIDSLHQQAAANGMHAETLLSAVCFRHKVIERFTWSPFHHVRAADDATLLHLIDNLLARGAAVDGRAEQPRSPLIAATLDGFAMAVEKLLVAGARPELRNRVQLTALDYAVHTRQHNMISILKPISPPTLTAVRRANRDGDFSLLEQWLESGARINGGLRLYLPPPAKGSGTAPLLWIAAGWGRQAEVEALFRLGADLDAPCSEISSVDDMLGWASQTPLMQACWHGHTDVVKALVRMGANRSLVSASGKLASTIADAQGHVALARYLRSYDAMRRWRLVTMVIGPLLLLYARARERANAPNAPGFEAARRHFEDAVQACAQASRSRKRSFTDQDHLADANIE